MRKLTRGEQRFRILKYRYLWFGISAVVIIVSIVALFTRGLNFGIDFTGGTELQLKFRTGARMEKIRSVLGEFGYSSAKIQRAEGGTYILRTPTLKEGEREKITAALKEKAGLLEVLQVNEVGPGWGAQVSKQAVIALIVFLFAVLIYISARFEFKMAVCAIVALFHDVIATVGVYSLVGRQVNPATVIAVLTILGYSLYDTMVVFDRVKENADPLTKQSGVTYTDTVNVSINQTLVRSLNTSLTTLVPIITILIFGGATLKDFAFALLVGIIAGTYSSIFFAPLLLAMWKETEPKYRALRERAAKRKIRIAGDGRTQAATAAAPGVASFRETVRMKRAGPAEGAGKVEAAPKPGARKPAQTHGEAQVTVIKGAAQSTGSGARPGTKASTSQRKQSAKASAKARTKGPGSGKKKKKR